MRLFYKVVSSFIFIIILFSAANILSTSYVLENMQEERLKTAEILFAKSVSERFFRDVVEEKAFRLTDTLFSEKKLREEKIEYILIFDKKGYLLAHTYMDTMPKQLLKLKNDFDSEEEYRIEKLKDQDVFVYDIAVPVKEGIKQVGTLHVGVKGDYMQKMVKAASGLSSIVTLIVMGIGIFVALFISRVITKPIAELREIAAKIGKGNLGLKIKVRSKDEIGELTNSFNHMTQSLKKNRDELQEWAKILEQRVAERTKELEETNAILRQEVVERKRAEKEVFQLQQYNRGLIEASLDPLVTFNQRGIILDVNEAMTHIIGKTREELIGSPFANNFTDVERAYEGVKQVFKNGEVRDYELLMRARDENTIAVICNVAVYKSQRGEVAGAFAAARDITERKQAEEMLKDYSAQLEKSNKELDDFTYIVSHDLKEPLRSIDAFSKFIEDDYKDKLDEAGRNYIGRIRTNTGRMQALIEDLLEISRIERKRDVFEEVESKELVNEAELQLEYTIEQRNAEIIFQDTLPRIFCDRLRLKEVFINLISNAVKFNDKQKPKIEIGCNQNDIFYEFYVRDNGPGIEEQYFDKIFEIFQRLGNQKEREGTGAGLTIVKKIVEKHKGKIWVESKVGEETTFFFSIPKDKEVILGKRRLRNKKKGVKC